MSKRLTAIGQKACGLMKTALFVLVIFVPASARASDPSVICDHAAAVASMRSGVPISVLKAISLTETGRTQNGSLRPWPWTVNMEGKGVWFETEDDARAYVYQHYKRGARSFDVGCFQLNYKWHHQEFASIEEMFDPVKNAEYAAEFLKDLYAETGDWERAAGTYHSRTPEHSNRYQKRFAELRAPLKSEDGKPINPNAYDLVSARLPLEDQPAPTARQPAQQVQPRVNTFPLLQKNGQSSAGSLVPIGGGTRGDFIDFGAS